ncbi:prolactin-releasing peptide receptor-like [Glandiceps talaboti]
MKNSTLVADDSPIQFINPTLEMDYYDFNTTVQTLPKIHDDLIIILTTIFVICVLLSSIGNIIVVCVMTCARNRKASLNTLMLNLAMSDWTLGLLCLPFLFATTMMGEWIFGEVLCSVIPFAWKVAQIVSIFTVTIIGLDRYQVVMYPLERKLSVKVKNIILLVIWIVAVILSCPLLVFASHTGIFLEHENRTYYRCGGRWPVSQRFNYTEMYTWLLFILTYVIPLIILTTCYIQVTLKLWRRTLPGHVDPERDREQEVDKRKAIRTLVSLIILFAMCWLPLNVYNIFLITYNPEYLMTHWQATVTSRACLFVWLILSDMIFNPIVYVFLSENFRKAPTYSL